jgi:hypothetical protein
MKIGPDVTQVDAKGVVRLHRQAGQVQDFLAGQATLVESLDVGRIVAEQFVEIGQAPAVSPIRCRARLRW